MNAFTNALTKKNARTWNGALSNSSTGSSILDYFGKSGSYVHRTEKEVSGDMASIFAEDPMLALKAVFYNRMITRKCNGFVEETSLQKGQGQRDEFVKCLKWLEVNRPNFLLANLWLIPEVGRWSDLWHDSQASGFYHYLSTEAVYPLVERGMQNEKHRGLIAKYLPQIRSHSKTKTDRHRRLNAWAKGLCKYLGWSERDYRKFKSDPNNSSHNFQRLMCSNKWESLNFNQIPGKALHNLVSRKGRDGKTSFDRHKVDNLYENWLDKQPVAKFTGYPYELYRSASQGRNRIQTKTYNKQFDGLIKQVKDSTESSLLKKGVICALDTSGSMGIEVKDNVRAIDICVGLGIYFSSLLEGHFKDHVIMFDDKSKILELKGEFCDKVDQINKTATAWGSTNFQSVIDEIVRVRSQNPHIPIEDYPEVLLLVSDLEFNCVNTSSGPWGARGCDSSYKDEKTNYEAAMEKLRKVGLPEMSVIWWNVNGRFSNDFPSTIDDKGTTLISGFDPSIVSVILDCEKVDENTGEKVKLSPYEQMVNALDQEILNCLDVQ